MAQGDPEWLADEIALIAALISVVALGVAGLSAFYTRRQARAGERQAMAGEEAVRLQAEALKTSADDTARALAIARESSDASKASAEALHAQALDTHNAIEIAKRTAESAERLAEANEALAITGQRGWLVVADVERTFITSDKVDVRAKFVFKNVGKTPLAGIWLRHVAKILADDPRDFVGLTNTYHATLVPDGTIEINQHCECSRDEYSEVKTGNSFVYFYGNASYQDMFGYSRTTYWRWRFDDNQLLPCKQGNEFK